MSADAELRANLVAILFVADQPLDIASLARILETERARVETAVAALQEEPPAGLIVQRHGDQLQLAAHPDAAPYIRRLRGEAAPQRLSRAALEVLAIVAYRQPVTRAEIEAIRGVNSDHALETLLARGLVTELGRREGPGRPVLFGTTLEFLELIGLSSLDQLPRPEGPSDGSAGGVI